MPLIFQPHLSLFSCFGTLIKHLHKMSQIPKLDFCTTRKIILTSKNLKQYFLKGIFPMLTFGNTEVIGGHLLSSNDEAFSKTFSNNFLKD